MDQWNRICAVNCDFARTGADDVGFVFVVILLVLLVVLEVWKDASKDTVELGEAG